MNFNRKKTKTNFCPNIVLLAWEHKKHRFSVNSYFLRNKKPEKDGRRERQKNLTTLSFFLFSLSFASQLLLKVDRFLCSIYVCHVHYNISTFFDFFPFLFFSFSVCLFYFVIFLPLYFSYFFHFLS
jgi:hypothetical protein